MISARQDIANATKESITEWGFDVLIVYSGSGANQTVRANGRKSAMDITSEGMQIVNHNPYVSIAIEDLTGDPEKISKVKAPIDFFRPDPDPNNWKWWDAGRTSKTDEDWFVKVYLTETEQKP